MFKKLALALAFAGWATAAQAVCTPGALPFNLQNNTVADATQVMANFNQIVTGTATNCAASGANTDITSLGGLTTPLSQLYGGTWTWKGGTSTGSANAQAVATVTPSANFSLTQGKCVEFTAGFTNTASPTTLNVFSTGAVNVFRSSPGGPDYATGGEIVANNLTRACYDGTQYQLGEPQNQLGGMGPLATVASAATTDLGLGAPNHFAFISGVATINSFGTNADINYPFYIVYFNSGITLTNSAQLLLPGAANITTASLDAALIQYQPQNGRWFVMVYQRANGTAVVNPTPLAGFLGLSISGNAGTNVSISYNSAVLIQTSGNVPNYVTSGSFTINLTVTGCNGMDTGSRGTSNWLYIYIISDGTTPCATATLTQPTPPPTLPANYKYIAYAGAMRVNGAGNLLTTVQKGNIAQYISGTATVPTLSGIGSAISANWAAMATGAFVPATATRIKAGINATQSSTMGLAPNNTGYPVIAGSGNSNPAPCYSIAPAGTSFSQICDLQLESTNIYAINSTTSNGAYAFGWQDAVNAN